ncbi:MAG: hypothetical protein J0M02_05180, partial [Planctomycetes bacterium]|nr:hypothetical protein [Planctomycetota bacterium]
MIITSPPATLCTAEVGIIGGGFAAVAAARHLRAQGLSVILLDRQAAVCWEAGWTMALPPGDGDDAAWTQVATALAAEGALAGGHLSGAAAEVAGMALLEGCGALHLGYLAPLAAECVDGRIVAVIAAARSGQVRIAADRWLDASEDGELARLVDTGLVPDPPPTSRIAICLQRAAWSVGPLDLGDLPGVGRARLQPGYV